ncbi:hypothetical protein [uncultured Paenibacillus sp.]|nr:hypothetical protein [uncultured Paenibacillus sp.]
MTVSDPAKRYPAYAEAIRNSLLPPPEFRITGAAIWKKIDEENIGQVGGNVGRGRTFRLDENGGKKDEDQKIYVVDAFKSGGWSFFTRQEIAEVYVLCYSLGKEHVLSVHISGNKSLSFEELAAVVEVNGELLATIRHLVGGDSI